MILGCRKVELSTICESSPTSLLTGHSMFGTVYLAMLSCVIQLTHLNLNLINSGNTSLLLYEFKAEILGIRSRSWY